MALLDALAFSSIWVSSAAALLTAAAAKAMAVSTPPEALAIAFAGTLFVYNVDRLRDVAQDRETSPERTTFVTTHRARLRALSAGAALLAVAAGIRAGPEVAVLATAVMLLGLAHRRIKHVPLAKALYIAGAWTAIVVGIPALLAPAATGIPRVAAVLGVSLLANAVASSVRDEEAGAARYGPERSLRFARLFAAAGLVLCLGGGPVARLGFVPGATLAALVAFRPGERYGLLVVDGALVAGAAMSLLA